LTYAWRDKEMIANYIKNQREHHKQTDFVSEYRRLLEEQGIRIDERFFHDTAVDNALLIGRRAPG
jgi:hypothetical protein